ncbi:hypothetical protein GE061_012870 [Apolygus lucorum]|uniref:Uncharacterized protein n=1 Tax=Apolygus lucorum TaxID=248454 RepID=A0A6A4JYR4_APOLU|nr:hypothetical protein GE061_012870 [Apolygus lucorum]
MSQTCTKCNKAVKAFQRLLVYEPVKEPCKMCDRQRPYPSAPPFGTTIKVCSYSEMERICFPKLCDCPCREIPLCPDAKRRERICKAIYWLATLALFAYLFDSGIFRHPVHTTRLTESLKEMIGEMYAKEDAKEEKDAEGSDAKAADAKGKVAKGKDGEDGKDADAKEEDPCKDPKREYDKMTKTYNIANVWNAAVIVVGDMLITLLKLPKYVFAKTMEAINDNTEDANKEKKAEPKKADGNTEEAKKEGDKK